MRSRSKYRRRLAAALLGLAVCASCAVASPAPLRPVDGSYTIAQRWAAYKDRYPGIALPDMRFEAGQQILFDRLYKKDGGRELHIDVFLPVGMKRRQGVLLVHGGGWRSGDKSHFYALANRLAQRGYAVFLPEYRLSAESPYPTGLIDINDAIVWVKAHAEAFGFDARRLALGGASSGGQMASLLAYSQTEALYKSNPSDDTRVNALIDLDGVLDFTSPLALTYENAAGPESAAALWLGGSWEQAPQRWREASALTHLNASAPPTLIISSGLTRFTAGREAVEMRLKGCGVPYSFYSFENAPHDVWLFEPWLDPIVERMDAFLKKEAR
jgi:pectinesterase